jgi:ribonucleoside-diphosphate reductase alpha chain
MRDYYHGIDLDLSRDSLLSEQAMQLLKDYYMLPNEQSPQEAFARAALAYCGW